MRSKADVYQEHYGTQDRAVAFRIEHGNMMQNFSSPHFIPLSSWTTMKVPYEAPSHPELPTMDQIDKALTNNRIDQQMAQNAVCRVGDCVIKMGNSPLILQEAEYLLFLQENSQVRTAKLYAAFTCQTEKYGYTYYMVTEYLEGDILSYKSWLSYSEDTRAKVCSSISEQLRLLRSVPAEGYYGRVNRKGWRPSLYLLRTHFKEMCGPYDTYEDFVSAVYNSAELTGTTCMSNQDWCPYQEACLSTIKPTLMTCKGSQPTLTHLDPALKNIIIRHIKGTDNDDEAWEATFIDWADFGWYPAWMQTVAINSQGYMYDDKFFNQPEETEQYQSKVLQHFEDPYVEQVGLFNKMYQQLAYLIM